MSLWNLKANEDPVANQESLFEGVPDLEDDDTNDINASISIHREYVLNSSAYQWFITSLRTQLSLDWGPRDATEANFNTPIYQTIMSKLRSGTVSKRRAPNFHYVKYYTEIDNDILRTLENQGVLIKDFMALTSSAPKMLQASTVQDYVHRVWPSGGAELLTLVQKAFHGEHGSIYSI
ncbi:hypothetical protein VSDG_07787 [Cytospora chrysosperma]|uniref:Uncharacterized protein n=1 Tax=Cytospora chrysosperma TaxID=252740 RepID=A0A423VJY2_CYTCH|nr:hypothetical protein VSDG_07787 [Valsa sordida]